MIRGSLLLLTTLSMGFFSCLNTTDKEKKPVKAENSITGERDTAAYSTVQWLDSSRSLGTVNEGEILKIAYRFRNTGSHPLIIERVQPGCGCTVADYPKSPIAPGDTGEVTASFNSQGKIGVQKKNITVFANTAQQAYTLWFDVIVNKVE